MSRFLLLALGILFSSVCIGEQPLDWDDLRLSCGDRTASDVVVVNRSIQSLNGRAVKLRGYIVPSSLLQNSELKRFAMVAEVRSETATAETWKALPMHLVIDVILAEDSTTKFVTRPIEVEGKLNIHVRRDGQGAVVFVYTLIAQRIETSATRQGFRRALKGDGC